MQNTPQARARVKVGSVIQLSPEFVDFGCCIAIVVEVHSWGVIAHLERWDGRPVRPTWSLMEFVGPLAFDIDGREIKEEDPPRPHHP